MFIHMDACVYAHIRLPCPVHVPLQNVCLLRQNLPLANWLNVIMPRVAECVMQTLLTDWELSLPTVTGTERNRGKDGRDQGRAISLTVTSSDSISSHLGPGRLWTHGILMAEGGKKTSWVMQELHCLVSAMDSSTEDLRPCPFIVLNKNCNASVFISVSQCWKKICVRQKYECMKA